MHADGKLIELLDQCLQNKVEDSVLPPRVLCTNYEPDTNGGQSGLNGRVTIYSDGCEECLATIDYFRMVRLEEKHFSRKCR